MTNDGSVEIPDEIYESLLDATLSALVKHGYSNLTVRDIGEEWDRSRQLINYYFDGKDHLLSTVLIDLLEYAGESVEPTPKDDPQTRLREMVDIALIGPDEHQEGYWKVLTAIYEMQGQAHHHPEFQPVFNEIADSYVRELQSVIEAGIAAGIFREVDAKLFANAVDDMITGAQSKRIYFEDTRSPELTWKFINQFLIDELLLKDTSG